MMSPLSLLPAPADRFQHVQETKHTIDSSARLDGLRLVRPAHTAAIQCMQCRDQRGTREPTVRRSAPLQRHSKLCIIKLITGILFPRKKSTALLQLLSSVPLAVRINGWCARPSAVVTLACALASDATLVSDDGPCDSFVCTRLLAPPPSPQTHTHITARAPSRASPTRASSFSLSHQRCNCRDGCGSRARRDAGRWCDVGQFCWSRCFRHEPNNQGKCHHSIAWPGASVSDEHGCRRRVRNPLGRARGHS